MPFASEFSATSILSSAPTCHFRLSAARRPQTKSESRLRVDPHAFLTAPGAEKTLEPSTESGPHPASYKSFDGMLKGIEFARRRDWPFLGTCGGFQYALIEFARNVLGIADADSAENNSGSKTSSFIRSLCRPDRKGNAPKLSGVVPEIRLRPAPTCNLSMEGQRSRQRRILLQLRSQPGIRMGHHGSRFPVSPAVPRRNSRH